MVRAAAAARGMSVSTWLAQAAEAQVRQLLLREALDSAADELGHLDDDEVDRLINEARRSSTVIQGSKGAA